MQCAPASALARRYAAVGLLAVPVMPLVLVALRIIGCADVRLRGGVRAVQRLVMMMVVVVVMAATDAAVRLSHEKSSAIGC